MIKDMVMGQGSQNDERCATHESGVINFSGVPFSLCIEQPRPNPNFSLIV